MHIRSNPQTIKAFQAWVDKIIDDNVNNDQKALHFHKLLKVLGFVNLCCSIVTSTLYYLYKSQPFTNSTSLFQAKQTYDCNPHAQRFLPPLKTVYGPEEVKFCFLNELMFQVQKIAYRVGLCHVFFFSSFFKYSQT
jgi:hypothetical protein